MGGGCPPFMAWGREGLRGCHFYYTEITPKLYAIKECNEPTAPARVTFVIIFCFCRWCVLFVALGRPSGGVSIRLFYFHGIMWNTLLS